MAHERAGAHMRPLRVCIYARFSTDLQNDKSNAAQRRELREYAAQQLEGWTVTHEEEDAAKSGASRHQRPGLVRMMRAAEAGEFDVLLTEQPNRLARKLGEMGTLLEELKYARVRWFTRTVGEMDSMKMAFAGLTSESNLQELAHFTRRGLRECIEEGRTAGGLSFGYRLDRSRTRRNPKRGQVEILRGVLVTHPEEAAIVVRIYRLYAAGLSPKAIARMMNSEGIAGPRGRVWRPSTIHGNPTTGVGILNNELYIGRLVHGRRQYLLNPKTGRRGKAIMNPASALKVKEMPHLRIIDDDLWQQVKLRQAATRRAQRDGIDRARRPKYLFSKLTKCSECGGGFTTESRDELRCNNYRAAGPSVCTNSRVIKRVEVENRVLAALQQRFFTPGRLEEFSREYVAETNRLRAEYRARVSAAPRELEAVNRRSKQILELLLQDFRDEAWKDELRQIEIRRAELEATISAAKAEPTLPALHPKMADVFRHKIEQLAKALQHDDVEQRGLARQTLRGFIDRIVIPPGDGLLQVVGNLGEMLAAASGRDMSTLAAVAKAGCGGPQQIVPAALLGGSVNVKTLTFPTEVPDVRRSVG